MAQVDSDEPGAIKSWLDQLPGLAADARPPPPATSQLVDDGAPPVAADTRFHEAPLWRWSRGDLTVEPVALALQRRWRRKVRLRLANDVDPARVPQAVPMAPG